MLLLLLNPSPGGATVPVVTTDNVLKVYAASAVAYGTLSSAGGDTVTERGFVLSTSPTPTIADTKFIVSGTGLGSFQADITGLTNQTVYYIRAYATNGQGTGYGAEISFITLDLVDVHKHYFYKIYTDGVYVTTWAEDVFSDPRFRSNINGGGGELNVKLARPFDEFGEDEDVKLNNKVELWVVDSDAPDGLLLFSGYISGYRPIIQEVEEYVEVTVFSFEAELSRVLLRDASGNTTVAYNSSDPSDILKDVIDKYVAQGGNLGYSGDSIAATGTSVSYTFNTNTIKECLDKIIELCPVGWYYRVDPNGYIYLAAKNTSADHSVIIGLHVENLETYRRVEDLVNRVLVTGGGSPPLFKYYENTASQSAYGLYERKIIDERITVAATAQTIAQRIIDNQKDPEIRSRFVIVDSNGPRSLGYNIESIKVGQTIRVKNLKTTQRTASLWDVAVWDVAVWDQALSLSAADVIQILSVEYTPDSIVVEASSRLPQVAKRIEDINRNLEVLQTVNNPAAPS